MRLNEPIDYASPEPRKREDHHVEFWLMGGFLALTILPLTLIFTLGFLAKHGYLTGP